MNRWCGLGALSIALVAAGCDSSPATVPGTGARMIEGGFVTGPAPSPRPFVVDVAGVEVRELTEAELADLPGSPSVSRRPGAEPAARPAPTSATVATVAPVVTSPIVVTTVAMSTTVATVAPVVTSPAVACLGYEITGPTFPTNEATLTAQGRGKIAQAIVEIRSARCLRGPDERACAAEQFETWVRGHTDSRPIDRPGGNPQLSVDRAEVVAGELRAAGLAVTSVEGYGSDYPAAAPDPDTRTEAERHAADRRTEIVVACRTGGS